MPMQDDIISWGAQYVPEVVPGDTPANPDFNWFGLVQNVELSKEAKELIAYGMDAVGEAIPTSTVPNSSRSAEVSYGYSVTIKPQLSSGGYNWSNLPQLILGGTTGRDARTYYSVHAAGVSTDGNTYHWVFKGTLWVSFEVKVDHGGDVEITMEGAAQAIAIVAPTLGTGSNATAVTTDQLISTDSYVTRGGSPVDNTASWSFKIDSGMEASYPIRQTTPEEPASIRGGSFTFESNLSVWAADQAELAWVGAASADLVLNMDSHTLTMAAKCTSDTTSGDVTSQLTPVDLPFTGTLVTIA